MTGTELNWTTLLCFPDGSAGKESACNAGDLVWIPGSGRSPQKGNGNPLQYSCLDSSMATVHGIAESYMTERLTHFHILFSPLLYMFVKCFLHLSHFLNKRFLLKDSLFTMFYLFQVYSRVIQIYIYIYNFQSLFPYRLQFPLLHNRSLLVISFLYIRVYLLIPNS